ncbi:hypothetical protein D917_10686, partial [Trichinella nativa]
MLEESELKSGREDRNNCPDSLQRDFGDSSFDESFSADDSDVSVASACPKKRRRRSTTGTNQSTVASGPTPAGTGRRRGVGRPRRHAKASKADEEDDYEATLPKRKCTLTNGRGAGRPRKRTASS